MTEKRFKAIHCCKITFINFFSSIYIKTAAPGPPGR